MTLLLPFSSTTLLVNPLNGVLRLSSGSKENTGRLEVYYGGRWGTVCDDLFNHYDSEVSCVQMGFAGDVSYRTLSGATGPIWLDNLQCAGTETWLASCTHNGWGVHDCTHSEDVGLTCSCEFCSLYCSIVCTIVLSVL